MNADLGDGNVNCLTVSRRVSKVEIGVRRLTENNRLTGATSPRQGTQADKVGRTKTIPQHLDIVQGVGYPFPHGYE